MAAIFFRHNLRIAVVEDDDSVRKALGRLLASFGLQVEIFASGKDFLRALNHSNPHCLVLDAHMPDLDGLQLQARLAGFGLNLPIIFISASANDGEREKALEAGASAFLRKPFDEREILFAIIRATEEFDGRSGAAVRAPRSAAPKPHR